MYNFSDKYESNVECLPKFEKPLLEKKYVYQVKSGQHCIDSDKRLTYFVFSE